MRYGTFHKCFTLWIIRMLITLFSENCHLLFSRHLCFSPDCFYTAIYWDITVAVGSTLFSCFPDTAYFCVLSVFASFRYAYITLLFKLLISLIWAAFYRLCLFTLFGWVDPLRYVLFCYRSFTRLLTCFISW